MRSEDGRTDGNLEKRAARESKPNNDSIKVEEWRYKLADLLAFRFFG